MSALAHFKVSRASSEYLKVPLHLYQLQLTSIDKGGPRHEQIVGKPFEPLRNGRRKFRRAWEDQSRKRSCSGPAQGLTSTKPNMQILPQFMDMDLDNRSFRSPGPSDTRQT